MNKLLTMHRYQAYLHEKLDPIYPSTEVGSFSRLLLKKLAGMSSVQIYSDKDRYFPDETLSKLQKAIDRLASKEPIQYILRETEFCGLPFHIGPGALIPRQETEELVERIRSQNTLEFPHVLDIGTGSGCIAVALAKLLPSSKVIAWDISADALRIAAENALLNQVEVSFKQVDVLTVELIDRQKASLDILVSNPPYVRFSEADEMEANVLDHEPHVALFVENNDALLFYRVISKLAVEMLKPGGSLFFEINSYLGQETMEAVKAFPFKEVILIQDLSGKDRIIQATR